MITFDKTSHPSEGQKAEEGEEEEIRITPPTFVEEKKISWIIDESTDIEFVMKRRGDSFFPGKNFELRDKKGFLVCDAWYLLLNVSLKPMLLFNLTLGSTDKSAINTCKSLLI